MQGGPGAVETVLHGPVRDQAELHGLLDRIKTLGLELVEVRRLPLEVAARSKLDLHPGEQVVFEGHPSWRGLLSFYIGGFVAVAAVGRHRRPDLGSSGSASSSASRCWR